MNVLQVHKCSVHLQRALQALSDGDSESESDHNETPFGDAGESPAQLSEEELRQTGRRLESQLDSMHPLRPSSVPKQLSEVICHRFVLSAITPIQSIRYVCRLS
jgi:hypothetical protein